jgi:hypothetical protein
MLRGCGIVAVRVDDVTQSGYAMDRATIAVVWAVMPQEAEQPSLLS